MVRIAVFVSGGGTNFQALIDAKARGKIKNGELALCVSSNENAYALKRAENHGIKSAVIRRKDFADIEAYSSALTEILEKEGIELIILAGFLTILPKSLIEKFPDRIINVHPSLIPSFCGEGFYGLRVHEAALDYGVKVTGATVHLVSEVVDGGRILLQKAVDILPDDTPEILQKRVMEQAEWVILPRAASMLCDEMEKEKESR